MLKFLFLCIILSLCGCYTCSEFMDMEYDSCMNDRNNQNYCIQRAKSVASDFGYCSSTNINFNF